MGITAILDHWPDALTGISDLDKIVASIGYIVDPSADKYKNHQFYGALNKINTLTNDKLITGYSTLTINQQDANILALAYTFRYFLTVNQNWIRNQQFQNSQGGISASISFPPFPEVLPQIVYNKLIQGGLYKEQDSVDLVNNQFSNSNYDLTNDLLSGGGYLTKDQLAKNFLQPHNVRSTTLDIKRNKSAGYNASLDIEYNHTQPVDDITIKEDSVTKKLETVAVKTASGVITGAELKAVENTTATQTLLISQNNTKITNTNTNITNLTRELNQANNVLVSNTLRTAGLIGDVSHRATIDNDTIYLDTSDNLFKAKQSSGNAWNYPSLKTGSSDIIFTKSFVIPANTYYQELDFGAFNYWTTQGILVINISWAGAGNNPWRSDKTFIYYNKGIDLTQKYLHLGMWPMSLYYFGNLYYNVENGSHGFLILKKTSVSNNNFKLYLRTGYTSSGTAIKTQGADTMNFKIAFKAVN